MPLRSTIRCEIMLELPILAAHGSIVFVRYFGGEGIL